MNITPVGGTIRDGNVDGWAIRARIARPITRAIGVCSRYSGRNKARTSFVRMTS